MKKTDITIILDRSGSMACIKADTIGGVNTFIEEQKKVAGEATFTLVQFDNHYDVVHDALPMSKVPLLTDETFAPRGSTALLDAMGKTINTIKSRISLLPEEEKPEEVIVVVVTDGQENASREFNKSAVFELIEGLTNVDKWNFVFLGANQDAIAEAAQFGVKGTHAMTYGTSGQHVNTMYSKLSNNVKRVRCASGGTRGSMAWSNSDRTSSGDTTNWQERLKTETTNEVDLSDSSTTNKVSSE